MRDTLEQLLRIVDPLTPERAQLLWDEYRNGADSPAADVKRRANDAFATLLACYGGRIYSVIWGFIRSDDAVDVFQDVLKEWHEHRLDRGLADVAKVLPWLRKVAQNKCRDALRRITRRRVRESSLAQSGEEVPPDNPDELQEMMRVALAQLTEEQRQAVALHYFEGLDKQDAAAVLGIDRKTFGKRLDQAIDRLRSLLPVLALGGAFGVTTVLTARPPAISAMQLTELAVGAWAKATSASWSFGKVAAVLVGLAISGAVAGGWALTREPQPEQSPAHPEPTAIILPKPTEPSVPERNLALFHQRVFPEQLEGLRGVMIFGDGEITLLSVEVNGTWIIASYQRRITVEGKPPRTATIEFTHEVESRVTDIYQDLTGTGTRSPARTDHHIVWWRDPFTKREVSSNLAGLTRAMKAFDLLPRDEDSAREFVDHRERLRLAARSYFGTWHQKGNPAAVYTVYWKDGLVLEGAKTEGIPIDPKRRLTDRGTFEFSAFDSRVILSEDQRTLSFPDTGDWWTKATKP